MVIIHNNTKSAHDQTARQMMQNFFKKLKKSDVNAFLRFIKKQNQTEENFNTIVFIDPYYKPVWRATVEEAYTDALNADFESPSFIRIWKENGTRNIVAAVECSIFADLNPDDYRDERGHLTQDIKDLAVKEIKAYLLY